MKTNTSFAYASTFCSGSPGSTRPCIEGSACMVRKKGSSVIAKRSGDNGQPCLVPFPITNGSIRLIRGSLSPHFLGAKKASYGPKNTVIH